MGKNFQQILDDMENLIGGDSAYSLEPQDFIASIGEFVERLKSDALDGADEETTKLIREHGDAVDLLESPNEEFSLLREIPAGHEGPDFLRSLADSIEGSNGCMWQANSNTCKIQIAYRHCSGKCLKTCVTYQNIADRLRKAADSFAKCRKHLDECQGIGLTLAKQCDKVSNVYAEKNGIIKRLKDRVEELEKELNARK